MLAPSTRPGYRWIEAKSRYPDTDAGNPRCIAALSLRASPLGGLPLDVVSLVRARRDGDAAWWQHLGLASRRVTGETKIFELSVVLRDVRPPVRRRVQVPGEITLAELHEVIQLVMGWTDTHLHEFAVGDDRYGCADPDWGLDGVADEAKVKLFRLVAEGERFEYLYDFGDGWSHVITVEKVLAAQPGIAFPQCVSGRRACPPEDVGGPWGYGEFVAAIGDPSHAEHEHFVEWIGGGFDPAAFDRDEVNEALGALAWQPLSVSASAVRSR